MDKRKTFLKKAKEKVREAFKSRDMIIGSVSRSIEELDEVIHLMGERLEDWYSIYFPEIKPDTHVKYANLIIAVDKKNIDKDLLLKILGPKGSEEVLRKIEKSLGADLGAEDLGEIKECARMILELDNLRNRYEKYQDKLAQEICPNIAHIAGSDIAGKMIAHVGSLKRLAFLPASTIQVIGAEKALFKHLKNRRIPPPKHGIIFQFAKISGAPKVIRGKLSRVLANAICTAAKADYITKNYIAEQLKQKMDQRISEINQYWEKNKDKIKEDKVNFKKEENDNFSRNRHGAPNFGKKRR